MGKYVQAYQHVLRIGDAAVEGILTGKVYLFPKIDGTNGAVWADSGVQAGSRRRVLDLGEDRDNAGFFAYIKQQEKYAKFLEAHPELVLWGEWLVPHTIKNYRDDAWRKFYVFDVGTVDENDVKHYLPYDVYSKMLDEFDIEYLTPLKIIMNPSLDDLYFTAENNFYLMKQGEIGEGIVCKNYDFINEFGHVIWGKVVRNSFKEQHYKTMGSPESTTSYIEQKIVDKYMDKMLVEKEYAKIVNDKGSWDTKLIPMLFGLVQHAFIEDYLWNILKDFKNPKIDFKLLNSFIIGKVKELKPELF